MPADDGKTFVFTQENRDRLESIARRYPENPAGRRSAILPALYLVQRQLGYVSLSAIAHVAGVIGCTSADVEDVVSFYTMFYTRPVGKFVVQVCRTLPCALRGAERVTEELIEALGTEPNGTDASGTFTLMEVECLGRVRSRATGHGERQLARVSLAGRGEDARGRPVCAWRSRAHWLPSSGTQELSRGAGGLMDPILTKHARESHSYTLDFYLAHEGYEGLRKALSMKPEQLVDLVKASGLKGRGGAGFPTGMKWQFVVKDSPKPKYIVCNADESEPGTFKDHLLMERNPHLLFEGCMIGCHAIGAKVAYIYIRGEFFHVQQVMEQQLEEAYRRSFVGRNAMGLGFDFDIYIHRGAGAYEAGEETALLESLEGKRAQPRLKPPFPASAGLYGSPTAVNNVETLCNVPAIVRNGAGWYAAIGPEKNGGPKLYCISGHVEKPGVYETSMSVTLRQLIFDYAGGVRDGRALKAVIPGGSSVPILLPDQLDVEASFDSIAKAGSLLGSAGIIVLDDTTCMVWLAENLLRFYRHESCGKCTPCREGTQWLLNILEKIERGEGEMKDLALLESVAGLIAGKTLCAFGDAAATPALTTLKHFRAEYQAHVREGRCTVPAPWRRRQPAVARSH